MKNPGITQKKFEKLIELMKKLGIDEADLEESFTGSSGPGGQNVNKNSTCVHLIHKPSSTYIKMQQARSQGMNRYYARKRLCEIIEDKKLGSKSSTQKKIEKIRKQKQKRKARAKAKTDQTNNG